MKTIRFKQQRIPAILDGSMTAFRRPIKPQPPVDYEFMKIYTEKDNLFLYPPSELPAAVFSKDLSGLEFDYKEYKLPYQVGDLVGINDTETTVKITDVRVERLRDINDEELLDEGMPMYAANDDSKFTAETRSRWDFIDFWNEIYADKGFGWDIDPWVLVYGFEVAE